MDYLKTIVTGLRALLVASVAQSTVGEVRAQSVDTEQQAWDRAQQSRTPEAYQGYLDQYPAGRFAVDAFRGIVSGALPAAGPGNQLQPSGGNQTQSGQAARTLY